MKKILFLLTTVLVLSSCSSNEPVASNESNLDNYDNYQEIIARANYL